MDSDLEAKTVEVVGNAGPFEVGLLSVCWSCTLLCRLLCCLHRSRWVVCGAVAGVGGEYTRYLLVSCCFKPDRNGYGLVCFNAIPTFMILTS